MSKKIKIIDKFYGGDVKDDKSRVIGAGSNFEELDIFDNENYITPTQIFSNDSLPTGTEIYSFDAGNDDTLYGYGKETTGGLVRLIKLASSGTDNPGSFATELSSGAKSALVNSPVKWHEVTETTQKAYLYYIVNDSGTYKLYRYGDLYGTPAESLVGTLSGLSGTYLRPWMKRLFGELYIGHGQYIAHVDDEGVFTEKKFTLPNGWSGIDAIGLSDTMLILCQSVNKNANEAMIYQWDLTSSTQFDDSVHIPMGGPQWIVNHKEAIRVLCAKNGKARLYQLNGSFPLETHRIDNVGSETNTRAISPTTCVAQKEGILYFGLTKTDKTAIYSLGKLNENKPVALILAKRFNTTDYSLHTPIALFIQGPNFYSTYDDNGTHTAVRCETNNSPSRSSNAVYESVWIDDGMPLHDKQLFTAYLTSYPLPTSTSLDMYVATDYSDTYTQIKRPDSTIFNTATGILGFFRPSSFNNKKAFKVKIKFTSNLTDAPKLQSISLGLNTKDLPANL